MKKNVINLLGVTCLFGLCAASYAILTDNQSMLYTASWFIAMPGFIVFTDKEVFSGYFLHK